MDVRHQRVADRRVLFQAPNLVGVTAGESENPRKDMPRAIRTVFWRIMLFYIGAIAVIGFLLPYTDPSLLASANKTKTSPPHRSPSSSNAQASP